MSTARARQSMPTQPTADGRPWYDATRGRVIVLYQPPSVYRDGVMLDDLTGRPFGEGPLPGVPGAAGPAN